MADKKATATTSKRAALRAQREAQESAKKRRRIIGVTAGVVLIAMVVVAVVFGLNHKSDDVPTTGQITPPSATKDGVYTLNPDKVKAGAPTVTVFQDYQCPACKGGEGDVPQSGGVRQVRLATGVVTEEGQLGDPLRLWRDRRVELVPVHRQADSPPQVLESFFIDGGQLDAQLDEVATANWYLTLGVGFARWGEVGVVRQRGITAYAVVVLHATLSRKTVVVPTHRVKNLLATHPLIAGNSVGVGVGEDVTGMQVA